MPSLTGHAVQHAIDLHTTGWLNVLPPIHYLYNLSAQQFFDDGYGGDFSLTHVLDCHKGGLITQHHNEIL